MDALAQRYGKFPDEVLGLAQVPRYSGRELRELAVRIGVSYEEAEERLQEPLYGPYERYCFNEAVMARIMVEERARIEAPRSDLELDSESGGFSGKLAGAVGEYDTEVYARYEAALARAGIEDIPDDEL